MTDCSNTGLGLDGWGDGCKKNNISVIAVGFPHWMIDCVMLQIHVYIDATIADFVESKLPPFFTYEIIKVTREAIPFQFYVCPEFVNLFDGTENNRKMCFIPACYSNVKDIFPGLKEEQYNHPFALPNVVSSNNPSLSNTSR